MKKHINIPISAHSASAQSFIAGAPDARPTPIAEEDLQKQISLKLPTALLEKVDAAARELNVSRAGYIKMCLSRAVKE